MKIKCIEISVRNKFLLSLFVLSLFNLTLLNAQLSPVWVQRYAGLGDNSDKYNAIVKDANGNFYSCGYLYKEGNQKDFMVTKSDVNGDTLWMKTYNGTNNGDDEANAIALDPTGNVYVTGYTDGDKSNFDFLTIKYDASGTQLWTAIYNYELAYHDDQAIAIAVDSLGNAYVTGVSDESVTTTANKDYATIKYDAAGNQVFVARKNGFGNGHDEPVGIVADNNGNCYVTGRSDSGNDDDYITIKYNQSGTAQWTKLYDGGNGDDRAAGIVMTPAGNIVVTGRKDNGSDDDITTISYSTGGTQLWIKNFNGSGNGNDRPATITTDGTGNIYVAGESDSDPSFNTNYDFITIKYDNGGGFQWSQLRGGVIGAGNTDSPYAIVADANGNIYVTGKTDVDASAVVNYDVFTIKYDQVGVEQWAKIEPGNANMEDGGYAMVLDISDNPVIAGKINNVIGQQDALLIKYDPAGTNIFLKTLNGKGDFSDNTFVVKTDASGNVFLAGYTFSTGTNRDLIIRKYDSGGNNLKTFIYNGSKNDEDEATDMAIDAAGNVYVTGYSKNTGASNDFITIKLNNDLDTSWTRLYNFTVNESDKAVSVTLDINNNVYVTGYSDNNPADTIDSYDIVTIKYNNNGASQWTNRYNAIVNGDDKPVKVLVDQSGNTDITGSSWNGSNFDFITLQYGPTGSIQWVSNYTGTAGGDDKSNDMVLDQAGNIYVTGYGFGGTNFEDYVTLKYNQAGSQQWMQVYNGTGNNEDKARGIALDGNNNVIVTGQSDIDTAATTKNFDYVTVKYDNSGSFQWAANYNGSSNTDDIPSKIITDANNNILVAGQSENGSALAPNKDVAVVGYNTVGTQQFYAVYDGFNGIDGANAISIDGASFYVAGNSNDAASQKDIVLIKYDNPSGVNENESDAVTSWISPNPVSENATIHLKAKSEIKPETHEIEFFDIIGNKLELPYQFSNGQYLVSVQRLLSGIYFYQVKNQNLILTSGKFIKQ